MHLRSQLRTTRLKFFHNSALNDKIQNFIVQRLADILEWCFSIESFSRVHQTTIIFEVFIFQRPELKRKFRQFARSTGASEPFFAACFLLFSCASVLKYQLTVWCIGNPVTTLFNSFVLQTPCHSTLKVSGIFLKRSFSANKSNSGYFVQAFSLCNKRKPPELFNVKTAIDR